MRLLFVRSGGYAKLLALTTLFFPEVARFYVGIMSESVLEEEATLTSLPSDVQEIIFLSLSLHDLVEYVNLTIEFFSQNLNVLAPFCSRLRNVVLASRRRRVSSSYSNFLFLLPEFITFDFTFRICRRAQVVCRQLRHMVLSVPKWPHSIPWWVQGPGQRSEPGFKVFGSLPKFTNLRELNLSNAFRYSVKFQGKTYWRPPINVSPEKLSYTLSGDTEWYNRFKPVANVDYSQRFPLSVFSSLSRLERLDLSYNSALSEEHIVELSKVELPSLTSLDISNSGRRSNGDPIMATSLAAMLRRFPTLKVLRMEVLRVCWAIEPSKSGIDHPGGSDDEVSDLDEADDDRSEIDEIPGASIVLRKTIHAALLELTSLEEFSAPKWYSFDFWKELTSPKTLIVCDRFSTSARAQLLKGPESCIATDFLPMTAQVRTKLLISHPRGADSILHAAAQRSEGAVHIVLSALRQAGKLDADLTDSNGLTPLMVTKSATVAKALIDAGANINAVAQTEKSSLKRHWTALHTAVASTNLALARLLLDLGASPFASPLCPIIVAVKQQEPDMRELLLEYFPNLLANMKQVELFQVLCASLTFGSARSASSLIATISPEMFALFCLTFRDGYGQTPLHLVAARDYLRGSKLLKQLLACGADPHATDASGLSPLWLALFAKDIRVVEKMLAVAPLKRSCNARGTGKRSCLGLLAKSGQKKLFFDSLHEFVAADLSTDPIPVLYDICRSWTLQELEEVIRRVGPVDFDCGGASANRKRPLIAAMKNVSGENVYGDLSIMEAILASGASPDVRTEFGIPAIMLAMRGVNSSGSLSFDQFNLLVKYKAKVDVRAALQSSSSDASPFLAQSSRPIPTDQVIQMNHTPLTYACQHQKNSFVKALLGAGCSVEFTNLQGASPLNVLLEQRQNFERKDVHKVMKLLLAAGADPNKPDQLDCPPLVSLLRHLRGGEHEKEMFLTLFEAGAKPASWKRYAGAGQVVAENLCPSALCAAIAWSMQTRLVYTPFLLPLCAELPLTTIKTIVDAAPELIHQPDRSGKLPIGLVASGVYKAPALTFNEAVVAEDEIELFEFLLARGADVRARDREGNTVMEYCIAGGQQNLAKMILACDRAANVERVKNDPNFIDLVDYPTSHDDMTPLVRASDAMKHNMVSLLLDEGAQVNKPSASSYALDQVTALHVAVLADRPSIVDILIKRGASLTALSRNRTPLQEALNKSRVNPDVVYLLVDAGSDQSILHVSHADKLKEILAKRAAPLSRDSLGPPTTWEPPGALSGAEIIFSSPKAKTEAPKKLFSLPPLDRTGSAFVFGSSITQIPSTPVTNPFGGLDFAAGPSAPSNPFANPFDSRVDQVPPPNFLSTAADASKSPGASPFSSGSS